MFKEQLSFASELNTLVGDLFDIKKLTKKDVDVIVDEFGEHTLKQLLISEQILKKLMTEMLM